MRNCVIWCVMLLTMAGTAFSETKEPPKEEILSRVVYGSLKEAAYFG